MVDGEPTAKKKLCFVVGPIGKPDTPTRDNADMLVDYVIRPTLEPLGYAVERADRIKNPGTISDEIINRVLDADLVVADLSEHNPNAFYELALRHREAKPSIHMITAGERIPFDVADSRAIEYTLRNPREIEAAREQLDAQARAIAEPGYKTSNPVTRAGALTRLAQSTDSTERVVADLVTTVRTLEARINAMTPDVSALLSQERRPRQAPSDSGDFPFHLKIRELREGVEIARRIAEQQALGRRIAEQQALGRLIAEELNASDQDNVADTGEQKR